MTYDENGWIPLCREMFERLGPFVSGACLESAESATWSGEPWGGALTILGDIEANGTVVESEFLERLAAWFLHEPDAEDSIDEALAEVFAALRERVANEA